MSCVDFVIPTNKEDLFQFGAHGQYAVEQTYSKNELPAKLRGKHSDLSVIQFTKLGLFSSHRCLCGLFQTRAFFYSFSF